MQKCLMLLGAAVLLAVLVGCETLGGLTGVTGTGSASAIKSTNSYKLPFSVTVAGQKAVPASEIFAKIANPVPADAEVVLGVSPQQVIINAFPSDLKGNSKGEAKVIIFKKDNKGTLDKTMYKSKLPAGIYLMNIVADNKTARVMFEVK